jgi:hypothetical protein
MDVTSLEFSPILYRLTYLYMELCGVVAQLQVHINYKQRPEMRDTMITFRRIFYELYYLVRIKEGVSQELVAKIEKWKRVSFQGDTPFQYYVDSIKLFDSLTKEMRGLDILKL